MILFYYRSHRKINHFCINICVVIHVVIVGVFFLVEVNLGRFFYCLFIHVYVLPLEIQLSRDESCDHINWFNPTKLCDCPKPGASHGPPPFLLFNEMQLFALSILVELLTITVYIFFSCYHLNSGQFEKCPFIAMNIIGGSFLHWRLVLFLYWKR